MPSDAVFLSWLRAAQIPPFTFETSLAKEKLSELRGIISEKSYNLNGGGKKSYLLTPGKKTSNVSKAAAVFAKELVLQRQAVICLGLAGLIAYSTAASAYFPKEDSDAPSLGEGFIVVPDICPTKVGLWVGRDWEMAQNYLLVHLGRGGGLVIGDCGALGEGLYNREMLNAFEAFEQIPVEL